LPRGLIGFSKEEKNGRGEKESGYDRSTKAIGGQVHQGNTIYHVVG